MEIGFARDVPILRIETGVIDPFRTLSASANPLSGQLPINSLPAAANMI